MTASALIALLVSAGFPEPQARAIEHYAVSQAGYETDSGDILDPCAKSWMGDGLFGLTRDLRRSMHAEAGTRGCVSAQDQVNFIAHAWPEHYPNCAAEFAAGRLHLFRKCFGLGEGS